MDTPPDQTANMPLLNHSTEQQQQHPKISNPEPSQSSQNDLRSPEEEKPDDIPQVLFPDDRFWSIAIWVKGANNGFSNIFSIFVGLSAGPALTQIKWRASGSEPLRMNTIDNLFALPAPLGLLKTLIRPRGSLFLPILSSVLIQALVLVSILAPSGLTVAPSEQVAQDIEVPIYNLTSQSQFGSRISYSTGNDDLPVGVPSAAVLAYLELTTLGDKSINSVLLNLPGFTWPIPPNCGFKWAFYFEYNPPGLECHDVIHRGSPDLNDTIYQADTNLYPPNTTASRTPKNLPYDLTINYTAITSYYYNPTFSLKAGTYCRFFEATYNALFELNSNSTTQRASTSLISQGYYLSWNKTSFVTRSLDVIREQVASWAICYAFAMAFRGNLSILTSDIVLDQPVLAYMFNLNTKTYSFEPTVSNLSQTLVNLFSNLAMGLISTRSGQDPVIANATIWDGSSMWIYTTWTLWAAYLPAIVLAIIVALYGLHTIQLSGVAMDDNFSSFLLATQNPMLSEMCEKVVDFEELERLRLIHRRKGTFVVVNPEIKSLK